MSQKIKQRWLHLINNLPPLRREKPSLSDNYTEALIGNTDYFLADISKCIDPYGNSYSNGWQYFTSIVNNLEKFPKEKIVTDFVKYIELIAHDTAYDGFRLNFKSSERLKEFPPACLPFLVPWSPSDIAQIKNRVNDILRGERLSSRVGSSDLNPLQEPRRLAENHFLRLYHLRNSIRGKGYNWLNHTHDPVQAFVLTRSQDHRILIFSGQHRIAVLSGLDYKSVPVRFVNKYIVNESGVNVWPLVRQGLWSSDDALIYFHHLFDFDSRAWAEQCGLLV
ncbi:MAG: hypothetical protein IH594_19245 [Bacteroidales bacterium]|nr:hypothetical protein [Bacteroidales bacterium]